MSALDEGLERLAGRGAEWGPRGLSNHGPMAAEALVELGFDDAVTTWIDRYATRLDAPRETESDRIPDRGDGWQDALGRYRRIGDWNAFFARRLTEATPGDVLATWVPRLAKGLLPSTHGAIRTAHAVRALDAEVTPPRLEELAAGLAYWAARCRELVPLTMPTGTGSAVDTLAAVPVVPPDRRAGFLIVEQAAAVKDVAGFGEATERFSPPADAGEAFDAIIDAAARAYLMCSRKAEIALIHTVTGPSALRMLLPFVDDDTAVRTAVAYAWQMVCVIASAYGALPITGAVGVEADVDAATWQELAALAVEDADEHTIKMVEACRREHARSGEPSLVAAARRVCGLPIA